MSETEQEAEDKRRFVKALYRSIRKSLLDREKTKHLASVLVDADADALTDSIERATVEAKAVLQGEEWIDFVECTQGQTFTEAPEDREACNRFMERVLDWGKRLIEHSAT